MRSIVFRFIRKAVAEIGGALTIFITMLAMYPAFFLSTGLMRVIMPVLVSLLGLAVYFGCYFIAHKKDRD